ncbi:MAG: hypothetical protein PF568_07785, partial [Deltaproteobacteria bacterium]|nr:hypothetical protein [Deltaproteobacteria bacterium]
FCAGEGGAPPCGLMTAFAGRVTKLLIQEGALPRGKIIPYFRFSENLYSAFFRMVSDILRKPLQDFLHFILINCHRFHGVFL